MKTAIILALALSSAALGSEPITASVGGTPVTQTPDGIPLEHNGSTLTTLHVRKTVTVELGNKDFLELSLPIFAYTVRPQYKVQVSDAEALRSLSERQARLMGMPLAELIQPANLKALRATQAELAALAEGFVKRVDPFDLPAPSAPAGAK